MLYKTICLGLLEQQPQIYDQLHQSRTLLPTLNRLTDELKQRHQSWMQELRTTRAGSDEQIASEALEIAVSEMEDRLSADSEAEALAFLDAAIATLRPSPPA